MSGGEVRVYVASMFLEVALVALDDLQLEVDAARAWLVPDHGVLFLMFEQDEIWGLWLSRVDDQDLNSDALCKAFMLHDIWVLLSS